MFFYYFSSQVFIKQQLEEPGEVLGQTTSKHIDLRKLFTACLTNMTVALIYLFYQMAIHPKSTLNTQL